MDTTQKLRATITAIDKDTIQVIYHMPDDVLTLPTDFIDQIYSILPPNMFYQDFKRIDDGKSRLIVSTWNSAIRKEMKPDSYEA